MVFTLGLRHTLADWLRAMALVQFRQFRHRPLRLGRCRKNLSLAAHEVNQRLFDHDDFEAVVRIFTHEQGGHVNAPFNGIRWDFCYAEDDPSDGIYMIHPDFLDANGCSRPTDAPLPLDTSLVARFRICVDAMRPTHQARIAVGTCFYCHEGGHRVASGTVTRLVGLHAGRGD